jgi:hypothetical protein
MKRATEAERRQHFGTGGLTLEQLAYLVPESWGPVTAALGEHRFLVLVEMPDGAVNTVRHIDDRGRIYIDAWRNEGWWATLDEFRALPVVEVRY